jgi:hypothetical protein
LLVTKLDASHVLGLVSFDCHPGSPYFLTSETHVVIARLCLLVLTPLAPSPQKATPIPTTTHTHSLSLSSEGHSLDLCAQMSPSAYPVRHRQLRAL